MNNSCDRRTRAYKNGRTLEQCKDIAESMNPDFKRQIKQRGEIRWGEILDRVDHDELVYKFTLKFLRRDGYDIGNYKIPRVTEFTL